MIDNIEYRNFFSVIYSFYNTYVHDVTEFDFNKIYTCNNIKQGIIELGIDYEFTDSENETLGVTILPINNLKEMIVLIKTTNKYDRNDVMRLIHELTHVYDFITYAKHYTKGKIKNFRNRPLFETYGFYSEIHAFSIDEFYSLLYEDMILKNNNLSVQMKKQKQLLNSFSLKEGEKLLSSNFTTYDLARYLGKIYMFDKYNGVKNLRDSYFEECMLQFSPNNKTERTMMVYNLVSSCLNGDKNIFDNLSDLDVLLNSITRY